MKGVIMNQVLTKKCVFCESKMKLNTDLNFLVGFERPSKVITSTGMPLVTYTCPNCGFVATFNAEVLGVVNRISPVKPIIV